jgi:hypothetical protein
MKCPKCASENADGKNFCSECGEVLDPQLIPIVRAQVEAYVRERFKDSTLVGVETSEAIAERFLKWGKWFLVPATILVALLGFALGLFGVRDYSDVHKAAQQAITEANAATKKGQELQETADSTKKEYQQLQSDADNYKKVNQKIEEIQKGLTDVQGQVIDLGSNKRLKVGEIETTGAGHGVGIGFEELSCETSTFMQQKAKVMYCAQGSPPMLFQWTPTGPLRAVSGASPAGFQDLSTSPKPICDSAGRGTFYVEKGTGRTADKAFLCARESDGSFAWTALAINH